MEVVIEAIGGLLACSEVQGWSLVGFKKPFW